jgi:3-oxoacyl-[acyl-carrier protein] reductase
MSRHAHDLEGYSVLVVGGTRGHGHVVARSFADAGARVTVTGTLMLRELYDTDLSGLDHDMVDLSRQDSIDHLVRSTPRLDVLVLAAGCTLPSAQSREERAFVAEAVRSGLLGPLFLATRLRLRLGQSAAPGGGCIIHTSAVRRWLELSASPGRSAEELTATTARRADAWAGIGVRVNTVLETPPVQPSRPLLPRQPGPRDAHARATGDVLVRPTRPLTEDGAADLAVFLAGPSGARITGQTIRVG